MSFALKLSIFTAIAGGLSYVIGIIVLEQPLLWELIATLSYLFLLTWWFHGFILKAAAKSGKQFVAYFQGGIAVKMFLSLILLVIYLFLAKDTAKPFAILFLSLYLSFSAFEVISLMKAVRKIKPAEE